MFHRSSSDVWMKWSGMLVKVTAGTPMGASLKGMWSVLLWNQMERAL